MAVNGLLAERGLLQLEALLHGLSLALGQGNTQVALDPGVDDIRGLLVGPEDTDHAVHARLLELGEGAGGELGALHLGQVDFQAHFAVEGGEVHRHAHDLLLGRVEHLGLDFGGEGTDGAEELYERRVDAGRGAGGRHLSEGEVPRQQEDGERGQEPRLE